MVMFLSCLYVTMESRKCPLIDNTTHCNPAKKMSHHQTRHFTWLKRMPANCKAVGAGLEADVTVVFRCNRKPKVQPKRLQNTPECISQQPERKVIKDLPEEAQVKQSATDDEANASTASGHDGSATTRPKNPLRPLEHEEGNSPEIPEGKPDAPGDKMATWIIIPNVPECVRSPCECMELRSRPARADKGPS